ncbi:surface-adhesin E family protein [Polynucleobacter sp. Tro8-14-1]|uniref:surface-adhesin E family protein n=1 Tax=Polynucleobacter sp. Tro8-14-1 TaxID=1758383 RepID=UPI001C0D4833|nr:surface-adhesin E family protein [Polynucleobacter sp. Tro8-14-1]MBU3562348.1 hypothetical protein [Polynucleobacter sp. Tro8-14-1]
MNKILFVMLLTLVSASSNADVVAIGKLDNGWTVKLTDEQCLRDPTPFVKRAYLLSYGKQTADGCYVNMFIENQNFPNVSVKWNGGVEANYDRAFFEFHKKINPPILNDENILFLNKTQSNNIYVEKNTIKKNGDLLTFTELRDDFKPSKDGVRSSRWYTTINCRTNQFKFDKATVYYEQMGKGGIVGKEFVEIKFPFTPILPNFADIQLMTKFCQIN